MRPLTPVAIAAALLLAGCASIAGTGKPPTPLSADALTYDTQVVVGPCPDPAESALLASIAAAVVAQGVNRIGDAIKAAAGKDTQIVLARRNLELGKGTSGLGPCVIVARGWFHREPPQFGDGPPARSVFLPNPKTAWSFADRGDTPAIFWRMGLYLAATPDFYFQGRIVTSLDKSSYTVLPVEALLERPISTTPLRPSGKRSVLVSLAFNEGGKAVDLQKGGGTTMALGPLQPGKTARFSQAVCLAASKGGALVASPGVCPDLNNPAQAYDTLVRSPLEGDWFTVSLGDKPKPMNVQALVSETRDASQFLGFVADVFGATKGDITTTLQEQLIASRGAAADETELSAKEKAANDLDNAFAKAVTDLGACVAAPSDPAKRTAARVSARNYMQAARKAEAPEKLSSRHVEAIDLAGADPAPCAAALAAVKS